MIVYRRLGDGSVKGTSSIGEERRAAVLAFELVVDLALVSTKPPGEQEHDDDRAGHQQQRPPHASTVLPRRCVPGRQRPLPASSPIQNAGARDRQIGASASGQQATPKDRCDEKSEYCQDDDRAARGRTPMPQRYSKPNEREERRPDLEVPARATIEAAGDP
jgi:hypothetical protein